MPNDTLAELFNRLIFTGPWAAVLSTLLLRIEQLLIAGDLVFPFEAVAKENGKELLWIRVSGHEFSVRGGDSAPPQHIVVTVTDSGKKPHKIGIDSPKARDRSWFEKQH